MTDAPLTERQRQRKLLILTLVLFIALPAYFIAVSYVLGPLLGPVENEDGTFTRPIHWSLETLIYLALGLVWAFPLKRLTMGVGKPAAAKDD